MRCSALTYPVIIIAEGLVILYLWSSTIITTHYKNLTSQETHLDDIRELLPNLPNKHDRTGLTELKNDVEDHATNHETPCNNQSYQFVNDMNIVRNLTSPVLLTTTNYGFLDLLLNLLYSIQRLNIQPMILVVCEDKTAYVELLKRRNDFSLQFLLALTHLQESVTNSSDRKTQPYVNLVQKRVSYVKLLIRRGLDVFYIDSDVVLLDNPFKYFIDNKYDVFAQSDVDEKKVVCTGFFYLRANKKTKKFVTTWRRGIAEDPWGNQFVFNKMLRLFQPKMKVNILPTDRFMSGKTFLKSEKPWFERSPQPIEVHANFIIGGGKKTDMLKKHQLWFVKD